MRSKTYLKICILGLFTFAYSCKHDNFTKSSAGGPNQTNSTNQTVVNGRLYFTDKESFQTLFDELKEADDDKVASFIDEKGITSLRPVVTEANEKIIYEKTQERLKALKANPRFMATKGGPRRVENIEGMINDIDQLDMIIGDDNFSALLNSNGEIQIGSDIYKYTDVGLFIVNEKKYEALGKYLEKSNISDNMLYPTDPTVQKDYISSRPALNLSIMVPGDDISYYPGGGYSGGGSSGGGGSGANTPPVVDPNVQMANFINSLSNCSTYTTFLQSLFGDSDMCIDKYEGRRRVKTKAYNYNYYLAYNLGVKVKHQYRGWTGFWRKEDADEIRLGVISGTFYYDYSSYFNPAPTQNRITTIYSNNNRYLFDANTYWTPTNYPGVYSMTGFSTQGYPRIFKDDYYIEDILPYNFMGYNPVINEGLYHALQAGNKPLSHEKLNLLFWGEAVKTLGNLWQSMGKSKPDNNITYSYNAVPLGKLMVAKTFYDHRYNTDDVGKTFDWGFQIGFTINSSGQISPSASPSSLKKPQEFRTLMYGIARKNGGWHGSKINTANF
ncbi:hypothetical protein HDE69_003206 [Pedobacter cryoconitis]|uniref:Uncharacterized protein n=1 Tax=Pedobacter cryoconitis TaxID=188932 RepID=A0A7W8YUN4_9SPHI|nr:hypothetical protein [Pedobacter cryoconitis]MBB5622141.1 hypothetical protein [Pedobacter cryoconitis]